MSDLRIVNLGASGLKVTQFCFGTLTLSPIQAGLTVEAGGRLIKKAVEEGVSFIDTAEGYRNYAHVRAGIEGVERERLVIATKSPAKTPEQMQASFDKACDEIGTDYFDIFHLHLISSPDDFEARRGALEKLKELKGRGLVRAIGITAHTIAPFKHVIRNRDIDICFPAFNRCGYGINDGTVEQMSDALSAAHSVGKGVYAMKPLGGGHLTADFVRALDFVRDFDFIDAVSVGMRDERELALNLAYFRGQAITGEMKRSVSAIKRRLFINRLCKKCGKCVEVCEQNALRLGEEKAEVDEEKCILCGYCAPDCPQFAIRII